MTEVSGSTPTQQVADALVSHVPVTVFPSGVQCACTRRVTLAPTEWCSHIAVVVADAIQLVAPNRDAVRTAASHSEGGEQ